MKILVTAGNTLIPIDQVRCLTNVFTGRTGARIAWHARERGHAVTLFTSHPDVVLQQRPAGVSATNGWVVQPYRTFDDLEALLMPAVQFGKFDAVVHCAAVSDYRPAGIFAPASGTHFHADA